MFWSGERSLDRLVFGAEGSIVVRGAALDLWVDEIVYKNRGKSPSLADVVVLGNGSGPRIPSQSVRIVVNQSIEETLRIRTDLHSEADGHIVVVVPPGTDTAKIVHVDEAGENLKKPPKGGAARLIVLCG